MSLRLKAASGVKWISSSTALTVILGFCQTIILSRLLDPKDFGLMAMMWVVVGFLQIVSDMGMGYAIVQRQEASPEQLSSVYWLTAGVGVSMVLLASLLARPTGAFYHQPLIPELMPLVGCGLLIASLGQPFQMLAQRDLRFSRLAAADMLGAVAGLATATTAALAGLGVKSMVYGGIASTSAKSLVLIGAGSRSWRPSFHFRWADLRGFVRFGAFQMGEKITNYSWNNVDYLLVGRFLGPDQLGIYRLAYEAVVRPLGTVNPILNTVSYPLFSKKQHDDEALRQGYLELIRLLCTVTFPLLVGLAVVAPVAVQAVFGAKWAAAAPLVRILCLLGALRSLTNPVSSVLMAKGRVHVGFWGNFWQAVASAIAFAIAAPRGVLVLSWTAVGVMVGLVLATWKYYYRDTFGLRPGPWLNVVVRAVANSFLMGGIVALAYAGITYVAIGPVPTLLALVAVGGSSYLAILWFGDRSYLQYMFDLLRRKS